MLVSSRIAVLVFVFVFEQENGTELDRSTGRKVNCPYRFEEETGLHFYTKKESQVGKRRTVPKGRKATNKPYPNPLAIARAFNPIFPS